MVSFALLAASFVARNLTKMAHKTCTTHHYSTLEDLFASGHVVVLDGGTGEELIRQGCPDDRKIWSAIAVKEPKYHNLLKQVHRSFLRAGAAAITTNSYGVTQYVGLTEEEVFEGCKIAASLARKVVEEEAEISKNRQKPFVLGSLGPLAESYRAGMGQLDALYLILSQKACVHQYCQMITAMNANVDAFIAETLSCYQESEYAVEAVKEAAPLTPMLVSYTLGSDGKLRGGEDAASSLRRLMSLTSSLKVKLLAILFNCSEPETITTALAQINEDKDLTTSMRERKVLLGAYANRLTPVDPDWSLAESEAAQPLRKDLDPEQYFSFVSKWTDIYDLKVIGGCCGITPEHIQFLSERL